MSKTKIKLIVETYVSKSDIYGNRYSYSVVTSTKTGKSIRFTTPSYSNTESLLRDNWEWEEMAKNVITNIPIREFDRIIKDIKLHNTCMDPEILEKVKEICQ